jgi:hypothetical protein
LKKVYAYFLIPAFFLGVIGIFFPLAYAIVPAHESGVCICNIKQAANVVTLFNIPEIALQILNTIVFYMVNWVFLLLLIFMFYQIRHIDDKLKTRDEMGILTATWTTFCLLQYFFFLCD